MVRFLKNSFLSLFILCLYIYVMVLVVPAILLWVLVSLPFGFKDVWDVAVKDLYITDIANIKNYIVEISQVWSDKQ